MSTRVRSEISPLVSTLIAYTIDDSSPLSHQSGNYGTSIYRDSQKTISDVVTSDYHARIKSGDIINNPMTLVHTEQEEPGGHFFYKNYEDSGFTWEWNVEPCYDWLALNHPSALVGAIERTWNNEDMVASAKLHALANIDPTPFSFAEDLAEIRTTARHLVQRGVSLKRLNDLYRKKDGSLKRKLKRSYNTSRKVRQEISSLWLEYRFAVSPLIRSITDLMDAANTKIVSRPPRLTSRGFESVDWDEEKKNSAGGSASYLGGLVHTKRRKGKDETSAGILYSVSNPLQGFRFKYGLRNKDIPVTIWAVVPYSFMIDRVFHISAALRAVTNLADPDVHILAAWSRSKIEDEETLSFDSNWTYPNSVPGVATVYVEGSKHKNKTFSYTRDVWKPTVADAIPPATYAKFVDSFTKLADITAITHTLLSKRQ